MGWNRSLRSTAQLSYSAFLSVAFFCIANAPANGQIIATISNGRISASLGESGQVASQNVAGRFIVTDLLSNNPPVDILEGPTTDLVGTATGIPVPGSFLTLRIDAGAQPPGQVVDPNWRGWDLIVGEATGIWLNPPTIINNKILASWATIPGAVATNTVPPIQVDIEISLVHDMARYKFTVFNGIPTTIPPTPASGPHLVGFRFGQNFTENGPVDAGANNSQGPVFLSTGQIVKTESSFAGSLMPDSWRVVSLGGTTSVGGLLRPIGSGSAFILPDTLLFSDVNIVNELWNHTPSTISNFDFSNQPWDVAAAIFWNPIQLPTASPTGTSFGTYFGRNFATIIFDRTWSTGVEGPLALRLDSTKPVGQQILPRPFTVSAFAQNNNTLALNSIAATINLPDGLELDATETGQFTKTVTGVGPGAEATFNWKVVANGNASGHLNYSVSFVANPGGLGSSVSRSVDVPAVPTQKFLTGLQMVSFPYAFDDPSPTAALGLQSFQFDLVHWNSALGVYEAVTGIEPGVGYWLSLAAGQTINLQGTHAVVPSGSGFELQLKQDWNQIGNPFLFGVRWSDIVVVNTDSSDPDYLKPLSVQQASDLQHQWILPTIYAYDTNIQDYTFDQDFVTELRPFVGYWIRSLKPTITLLFPLPVTRSVRPTRAVTAPSNGPVSSNNWMLRLIATSGKTTDNSNFIGLSPAASDGYDLKDVQKPPSAQSRVTLGMVRNQWKGRLAGLYARDIQFGGGGRKTWDVVVTSPKPNTDVTVSWPDISRIPRGYELLITDKSTGMRRSMRQSSSTRLNTGQTGTRAFTITAEPRGPGAFQITDLQVKPNGSRASGQSATITYVASQDATIQVRVLGANGQVIATLSSRAVSSGANQVLWNYRDARGVSVPSGAYTIEVKGATSDGSQTRAIVPHLLVR